MIDKKRRLFRLIEFHINNHNKNLVESFYGKGSKIEVKHMTEVFSTDSIMFELKVVFGDEISEEMLDKEPANLLMSEAIFWFFPNKKIHTTIVFDS